jgi:hypothetical protein
MNLEDLVYDGTGVYTAERTTVIELTNPITRYQCRLDPPYQVSDGRLKELSDAFNEYCLAAWEGPIVDEATGWRERINPAVVDPYRLLAGTLPLPDLKQLAADLVQAYGFPVAHAAVDAHDPLHQPGPVSL